MIREVLGVEEDTIVIPFSAETKQGREEIWDLVESLVEMPEDPKAILKEQQKAAAQAAAESTRKPRWKATDHPVAKKTLKKEKAKKAGNKKAASNKKKPKKK